MSSTLSKRKIADAFELTVELTRAQEEEAMVVEAVRDAREIADADPQGAQDVLHEHLPPWLRSEAEDRLI